jgi:hypothetical protein
LFTSPAVIGTLVAVQIGMVGYDFYQAMKSNKVQFNSDGSASTLIDTSVYSLASGAPTTGISQCHSGTLASLSACIQNWFSVNSPFSPNPCHLSTVYLVPKTISCNSGQNYQLTLVSTSSSAGAAATNQNVIDAINASSTSQVAAIDALKFALQQGVDVKALVPLTQSNATPASLVYTSPETVTSTAVDSLGNTTSQKQKTVVTLTPPATAADSYKVDEKQVTTTAVNASATPSNVQTITLAPPNSVNTLGQPVVDTSVTTAAGTPATPAPTDCDKFPNSIGCSDFGDVPDSVLPTKSIPIAITPITLGGAGACPAPHTFTVYGHVYTIPFTSVCDFATATKPFILVSAWLAASLIFVGGIKNG